MDEAKLYSNDILPFHVENAISLQCSLKQHTEKKKFCKPLFAFTIQKYNESASGGGQGGDAFKRRVHMHQRNNSSMGISSIFLYFVRWLSLLSPM